MPDNFPKQLTAVYPILYNYAYVGLEAVVTAVILCLPAVKKAMEQVKRSALS